MATVTASMNVMRSTRQDSKRRTGHCSKSLHEPWFALNRNAYQSILNVALAEMTSSSQPMKDGLGSNYRRSRSCRDVSTGSELLRLLRNDDIQNENVVDRNGHVTSQSSDDDQCSSENCSAPAAKVVQDSATGVVDTTPHSEVTGSCGDIGPSIPTTVPSQQMAAAAAKHQLSDSSKETDPLSMQMRQPASDFDDSAAIGDSQSTRTNFRQLLAMAAAMNESDLDSDELACGRLHPGFGQQAVYSAQFAPSYPMISTADLSRFLSTETIPISAQQTTNRHNWETSSPMNEVVEQLKVACVSTSDVDSRPPSVATVKTEKIDGDFSVVTKPETALSLSTLSSADTEPMSSTNVSLEQNDPRSDYSRHSPAVEDTDQKPVCCWVPICKDVMTTIMNRQLSHTSNTIKRPSPPPLFSAMLNLPPPGSFDATSGVAPPFTSLMTAKMPGEDRTQLLADLLHQNNEITAPAAANVTSPVTTRKRNHTMPFDGMTSSDGSSKPYAIDEVGDHKLSKRQKRTPDRSLSDQSTSPNGRIHVRSTWHVPPTSAGQRRSSVKNDGGCPTKPRNGHPVYSNVAAAMQCRRSDFVQSGNSSSNTFVDSVVPQNTVGGGHDSSQVWAAIDKSLILGVIDHLLDGDVEREESAIDLTVVRPSVDRGKAVLPSAGDLLTLLSKADRLQSNVASLLMSEQGSYCRRQTCDVSNESGSDGESEFGTGTNDLTEAASQLKWKSNIMQRMRREQSTMATPTGNRDWQRGGSSIAATGS